MNMNVIDMRRQLRRTPVSKQSVELKNNERRKTSDRREPSAGLGETRTSVKRIWLTPGERTLIEDLYFLDDRDFRG